ncbi:adenylate kinase, partial [Vibrio harveyi]
GFSPHSDQTGVMG